MNTLTRREAAKKLKIADTHLIYWEKKGKINPEKVSVGNRSLIVYTPELIEKARKIFSRKKAKK